MLTFTLIGFGVILIPIAVVALSARSEAKKNKALQPDRIPARKAAFRDAKMNLHRRRRFGSGDD